MIIIYKSQEPRVYDDFFWSHRDDACKDYTFCSLKLAYIYQNFSSIISNLLALRHFQTSLDFAKTNWIVHLKFIRYKNNNYLSCESKIFLINYSFMTNLYMIISIY